MAFPSVNGSVATIPQSPALSEAQPQSLQELFSLDPEKTSDTSFDLIISHMRQLREKLAASETTIRQVRVKKDIRVGPFREVSAQEVEDSGLL